MSYICDKCGKATKKGERLTLVPISFRDVEYTSTVMKKANVKKRLYVYSPEQIEDKKSDGWEVVKTKTTVGRERTAELKICPRCENEKTN